MTYADYQNTEPAFQDGPSDHPDRIRLTLNLTGPQVITLRAALHEVQDRAAKTSNHARVSHIAELLSTIAQAVKQ
jgi:hypothetical protein